MQKYMLRGNGMDMKEDFVATSNIEYEEEYSDFAMTQNTPDGEYLDEELSVGYRLGNYYIPQGQTEFGKGGQARVYECYSDTDDNTYIAKIYRTDYKYINKIRDINEQIKNIAASNIVRICDAGDTEDGEYYMVVMEKYQKLEKDFLNFELHGKEPKYNTILNQAVKDFNEALKQLHVRQIYHSDIKPQNVLCSVDENGGQRLVLIDFGGSVTVDDEEKRKGKVSAVMDAFSLGYQAPEQLNGIVSKANERTDAYSFGITLAEMVAGVYPKLRDLKSDEASAEQKAYYERNKEGRKVFGILLPVGLPNHIVRLFEGLLYYDLDEPDNQNYRWGNSKIDMWLENSMEGDYKAAATMKFGSGKPVNTEKAKGTPVGDSRRRKIFVSYPSGVEQISSTEEMAQLFYNKWDETIDTLTNNKNWVRSFSAFGQDVVQVLIGSSQNMRNEPENAGMELKKLIMLFASEELKSQLKNMYFAGDKVFTGKEDFGRQMYAALAAETVAAQKNSKSFIEETGIMNAGGFLAIINDGNIKEYFRSDMESWHVEPEVLDMMDSLESYEKCDIYACQEQIVKLFHIAFQLQNVSCFKLNGHMYTSYQEFIDMLENTAKGQPKRAKALYEECMVDGRYRIDLFAWLMAVDDIKERPDWRMAQL